MRRSSAVKRSGRTQVYEHRDKAVLRPAAGTQAQFKQPHSIAFDHDRAFFRSYDKAWKTKRLRGNESVDVAPATFRGRATGPTAHARTVLLTGSQAEIAAKALARGSASCRRLWSPWRTASCAIARCTTSCIPRTMACADGS